MSQPREPQAPTPELTPDSPPDEQATLAEPQFSGTLTPDTTTHPSIKNN
ncbi:MAG TPA: hypothetical protein VGU03_12710 [Frateuria sp.]|nr:hypothetical protein [Frateuria sp.]